jgi:Tol biopolymer transport system component
VKVLDFGLAKAFAAEGTTSGSEHTGTADGAILGTVPYMSPEQARGTPVDKRTDIWAFGCVLYELLTGRPAFAGPTLTDTLAAILEREPDWSRLPPTTPARVRELVQRCLVKDPRRRLRDIGDARLDLEALELPATPATSSTAPRTRERAWMGIAALATLGAAWLGGSTYFTTRPAPDPVSFTVSPPEGQVLGPFAMSPDGRHVAFVAGSENTAIWVRALDSPALRRLEGTEGAVGFAWSPDGRSVAFTDQPTNGKVKRVARTGGAPQTVTESGGAGLAWGDGVILVSGADGRLYRVPERGGDLVAVTSLDPSRQENMLRAQPQFLPDGRFLFQTAGQDASKRGLFLGSLDSSRTHLLDGLMTAAYADGHLLYNRDATLMAQPFDDRAARFTGEAFPTIERILTDQGGGAAFSVAQNGTLAYRTAGGSASGTLAWFDRQGKRVGTVGGPGSYENPRLSPDGRWLAACRREGGQRDIWTVDLERNVPTKLTSDPGDDNYPVWSSDGTRVIFVSNRSGSEDLYWRAADGSGSDERLVTSPEIKRPTSVSRDGTLLYTVRTRPGNVSLDVWSLSLAANHKPVPVLTDPGANEYNTAFSPDGRWIAFNRGEGDGTPQVYVQAFPATGGRVRVSTSSGTAPQWSSDGRQLFYVSQGSLAVVDMSQPLRPGVPQALPVRWNWRNILVIDRAGERFLRPVTGEADADEPITVIVNWTSTLPRK